MKSLIQALQRSPEIRRLYFFSALFFGGMALSKTVHPLWFQHKGALGNFGLSYSVMAIAGYMALYWGAVADKVGASRVMSWGAKAYALGMFLRIFPEPKFVVVLSGLFAGAGASAVIVALQVWVMQAMQHQKALGSLLRRSSRTFGAAFGLLLAAFLPFCWLSEVSSYQPLLIFAALLVLCASFIPCPAGNSKEVNQRLTWHVLYQLSPLLLASLVLNGFFGGMCSSFILPYLPIILREMSCSLFLIGNLTAITTTATALLEPSLCRLVGKGGKRGFATFLFLELAGIVVVSMFFFPLLSYVILFVLLLRSLLISMRTINTEVLWLERFNPKLVGLSFGVFQTAFFIGDSMGGMLAPIFFERSGTKGLIMGNISFLIIDAFIFSVFYFLQKEKLVQHNVESPQMIA